RGRIYAITGPGTVGADCKSGLLERCIRDGATDDIITPPQPVNVPRPERSPARPTAFIADPHHRLAGARLGARCRTTHRTRNRCRHRPKPTPLGWTPPGALCEYSPVPACLVSRPRLNGATRPERSRWQSTPR